MKNLSQYLLIVSVVFTFFSCHEESERFILEGKLFDAETGEPIQGLVGFEYKDSGTFGGRSIGTGFSFYDSAELDEEGYFKLIISGRPANVSNWFFRLVTNSSSNKYYPVYNHFTLSDEMLNIGIEPQGLLKVRLEDVPEITHDSVIYVDYTISGEEYYRGEYSLLNSGDVRTHFVYSNEDCRLQVTSLYGIRTDDINIDTLINIESHQETEFVIKY
jgi:hypothetical protein